LIGVNDSNPVLTGNVEDQLSNISSVKYAIWKEVNGNPKGSVARNWTDLPASDGTYDSLAEATNSIINVSALGDGNYTLGVRGWDAANNKGSGGDLTFVIDRTAPTATIDSYSGTDTTPTLTGNVDDPTADLTVTVDSGTAATATNNGDGTWTYTLPTALSVGSHTVVLTATDTTGNSYSTSANVTVEAPHASPQGIVHSSNNGNSNQATGHQPTVTVTPNNDGHVLGASTTKSNLPTVNFANTSNTHKDKTSNAFLGLGWWWLAVAAGLAIFWAVFAGRRRTHEN
jgi:hypothetical protein